MKTHAELKREYKETPVPMGVFLVRNVLTNEFIMQSTRKPWGQAYRLHLRPLKPWVVTFNVRLNSGVRLQNPK